MAQQESACMITEFTPFKGGSGAHLIVVQVRQGQGSPRAVQWRGDSSIKNIGCFCRGPRFNF